MVTEYGKTNGVVSREHGYRDSGTMGRTRYSQHDTRIEGKTPPRMPANEGGILAVGPRPPGKVSVGNNTDGQTSHTPPGPMGPGGGPSGLTEERHGQIKSPSADYG
ncbi:hypothetical protein GCM10020229_56270 [Kitasatospora albolonga]